MCGVKVPDHEDAAAAGVLFAMAGTVAAAAVAALLR